VTSNKAGGALPTPLVSMAEAFFTSEKKLKWTQWIPMLVDPSDLASANYEPF